MAERYTRLYTLPAPLYVSGAPIIVMAGALLRDNLSGALLGQLKLRGNSDKTVSSVSVAVTAIDADGNPVGAPVQFEYTGLSVKREVDFASGTPIPLPFAEAASFKVAVSKVCFDDGSVFRSNAKEWLPMPAQRKIKEVYPEYYQQVAYRRLFGAKAIYEAVDFEDMWLCTCSSKNFKDELFCRECGVKHADLSMHGADELYNMGIFLHAKKIAKEAKGKREGLSKAREMLAMVEGEYEPARELAEKIDQKLDEIRRKQRKRKKRVKTGFGISIPTLILVAGFLALLFNFLIPNGKYNDAMGYYQSGDYYNAYLTFSTCADFSDSREMMSKIMDIEADRAMTLAAEGKYGEAYDIITKYGSFPSDVVGFATAYGYLADGEYAKAVNAGLTNIVIKEGITDIPAGAFQNCTGLKSIKLPATLKTINGSAFKGCTSLTEISLPDGLISIYSQAFSGCTGLTAMVIPDSVTVLSESVFYGCTNLKEVSLPSGITSLSGRLFYSCEKLESITLPSEIESIGDEAFGKCSRLGSISIPAKVTGIGNSAFFGCIALDAVSIPGNVKRLGSSAFSGCTGVKTLTIGSGVKEIGDDCFYKMKLITKVTVPDSVTLIGRSAFGDCIGLTEITLPFVGGAPNYTRSGENTLFGYIFSKSRSDGTTLAEQHFDSSSVTVYNYIPSGLRSVTVTSGNIYYGAFYDCSMLTKVHIGRGVTAVGHNAFRDAVNLTLIEYNAENASNRTSGYGAFWLAGDSGEGLEIVIGTDVKTIPDYMFAIPASGSKYAPKVKSVSFAEGSTLKTINQYAFYGILGITELSLPNSLVTIENNAFSNLSNLEEITFGSSVKVIGDGAFFGASSLRELNLPESLRTIGSYAFGEASKITELTLPNYLESIGSSAFVGLSSLKEITVPFVGQSPAATSSNSVFGYIFGNSPYTGSVSAAQRYSSSYCNYYLPLSLTTVTVTGTKIPFGAFSGCTSISTLNIGPSVSSIDNYAFYGMSGLKSFNYAAASADNLSSNNYAFYNAGSASDGITVNVRSTVTKIPAYLFNPCSLTSSDPNLKTIVFENNSICTTIGQNAFAYCNSSNFTSAYIPSSVIDIGSDAFYYCSNLNLYCEASSAPLGWYSNISSNVASITYDAQNITYAFVTNGGDSIPSVTSMAEIILPETTREGYVFMGWYTNSAFGGANHSAGESYRSSTYNTLYAKWLTQSEYDALYPRDGASFASAYLLNESSGKSVTISTGGASVYLEFTPTESKSYSFYSTGSYDTYGYLYNSSETQLTYNDDPSTGVTNFKITYTLTAGQTYYIKVRFYSTSYTGTFTVYVASAS